MTNPFPTSVSMERAFGAKFKPPGPPKKSYAFPIAAFIGFFLAFGLCLCYDANVLLPAWGVFTLVGWGLLQARDSSG